MKFSSLLICGLLVTTSIWIASPLGSEAMDTGDKPPVVVSGYVVKIDLKKKDLTVHGTEVTPGAQPQKFAATSSIQSPGGGRGGGGRGGTGGGRSGGGGRGSRPSEETAQDFSVKVSPDTMIQTEKGSLTLNDLRVQDYVLVLGTSKGKSINATSISVTIP